MNRNSISNYVVTGKVPNHLAVIAISDGRKAEYRLDFRPVMSRIEIRPNKPRGKPIQVHDAKGGEKIKSPQE